MMAIRILLDHDVLEENIVLVSLLMAQPGLQRIAYAFPRVKLVTTAVDPELDEVGRIIPGLGNFGDRYFGTEIPLTSNDDNEDNENSESGYLVMKKHNNNNSEEITVSET